MKKLQVLLLLSCILLLAGCAEMFQGKVDMMVGSNGGGLSGLLSEKAAISKLATPAQLNVSQRDSSYYIDLNWSAVDGAITYYIQRATLTPDKYEGKTEEEINAALEELYEDLVLMVYGTNYRDTTATDPNVRYYYRVYAENSREKYDPSEPTNSVWGSVFGVPANIRADLGQHTDKVNVVWDAVDGATSYEIHRGTDASGAGAVKLASIPSNRTQYTNMVNTDEQGKEFYYTIYAVNRIGERSAASSVQMGFALVAGAPSQPGNVNILNGRGTTTGSITIKWDPVTAASGDITYYVYRSSSEDSALLLLGGEKNKTEYTDSRSLKPGVYYYYQVQAAVLDEADVELKSKFSESGKLTSDGKENKKAAEGFILSAPDEVFAEKTSSGISIKFSPAIGNDTERAGYTYKIYGDSSQTGTFTTEVASQAASELTLTPDKDNPELKYYNINVAAHNFYKVVTMNGDVTSKASAVVAPTPFAATIGSASQAGNFQFAERDANSSGVYPVKITWSKPTDDTPAGYHVYRSSSKDSGYRKITSDPVSADATLEFFDANDTAKAGKKYWYKVLAVNALGQGSYYSDPVQGWGALTHEQFLTEFYKTINSSLKKLTLMHKPNNLDKMGSETKYGTISGSIYYNVGMSAYVTIRYDNYADFYIDDTDKSQGPYFILTGNSDTAADMSANGEMKGTITCTGMYKGSVDHSQIQIKGGAPGGGGYIVQMDGFTEKKSVSYKHVSR